jgi:Putative metal-binding domain of cation transport ATPase
MSDTNKADTKKACDLCGLSVEVPWFTLTTKEGDKAFCCEGCKGIYKLLNQDKLLPESDRPGLIIRQLFKLLRKK